MILWLCFTIHKLAYTPLYFMVFHNKIRVINVILFPLSIVKVLSLSIRKQFLATIYIHKLCFKNMSHALFMKIYHLYFAYIMPRHLNIFMIDNRRRLCSFFSPPGIWLDISTTTQLHAPRINREWHSRRTGTSCRR